MIDLQELINKAQNKIANRKMEDEIEVPSLGDTLLFKRPKDADILQYENVKTNAYEYEYYEENGEQKAKIKGIDMIAINDISNKFVVDNCEYLRSEQLLKTLGIQNPYDVPKLLFASHKETNDIAEKVYNAFAEGNVPEVVKN